MVGKAKEVCARKRWNLLIMSQASRSKAKSKAKSRVNEAGNYTKPELRKQIFNKLKQAVKAVRLVNGLLVKLK